VRSFSGSLRYEIELEEYTKKIQIEGRVLGDIATNHVIQQLYVIKTL
jgi:glutamine synthetase type III